jgi:hypothetical protein
MPPVCACRRMACVDAHVCLHQAKRAGSVIEYQRVVVGNHDGPLAPPVPRREQYMARTTHHALHCNYTTTQ